MMRTELSTTTRSLQGTGRRRPGPYEEQVVENQAHNEDRASKTTAWMMVDKTNASRQRRRHTGHGDSDGADAITDADVASEAGTRQEQPSGQAADKVSAARQRRHAMRRTAC